MKHTKTSLFRAPRLALALSSLLALPALAVDPATVLPDESVAYMEVDSQAINGLKNHPVAKTLPLEKLEDLFLKMSNSSREENEKLKKAFADEVGMSMEELEKKMGRFAFTIHDLQIPANPTPENVNGELSIAVEMDVDEAFMEKYFKAILKVAGEQMAKQGKGGDLPDFDEIIKKAEEKMEHTTAEHGGAKIHVWKLKDSADTADAPKFIREWAFAFHEKMLLVSSGQDNVEEMIDRVKGGGAGSLASSALYKRDHEKAGKTAAVASLNLETILGLVEKYALPLADSSEVDVKKIWTTLGVDKLQSAALATSIGDNSLDAIALITYSAKPGLATIPAIPGSGSAPAFIPKSVASASYGQVDLDKTLDNLTKIASEVDSRAGAAISMGLGMVQAQAGVDVKKDILSQLGPDYWTAQDMGAPPEGGPNGLSAFAGMMGKTVTGIKVKDRKAFGLALDTLFSKAGGKDALFDTREYQGFTINNVKQSPEEFRVGYVLSDDWLILSLGGGEVLEQILSRISKGGDDGLFAQKAVVKALGATRDEQVATSVSNLGEILGGLFGLLEMAAKQSGSGPELPFGELGKLLNVPLLSVDKAWIDGNHAEYRMKIVPKGE